MGASHLGGYEMMPKVHFRGNQIAGELIWGKRGVGMGSFFRLVFVSVLVLVFVLVFAYDIHSFRYFFLHIV
jgi:hypothetical protein